MAGSGCGSYYQDPATGNCIDLNGNVVDPDTAALYSADTPTADTPPPTDSGSSSSSGFDFSAAENDFLTGFKTIFQPSPIPAGQTGISLSGAKGGLTLSGSPLILIALVVVAVLVLRR